MAILRKSIITTEFTLMDEIKQRYIAGENNLFSGGLQSLTSMATTSLLITSCLSHCDAGVPVPFSRLFTKTGIEGNTFKGRRGGIYYRVLPDLPGREATYI